MNCKKCGYPLVSGQIICSNCDTDNSELLNETNNNAHVNDTQNMNQYQDYESYNINENIDYEIKEDKKLKKQNACLKIASVLALLLGVALVVMNVGNLFTMIGLKRANINNLLSILISIIFVFYAFMLENFNLRKNKIYDSKVLFILLLIINVFACFAAPTYLIVLVLSVIGFITSIIKNK